MDRPPDLHAEGYEKTVITCRACGHHVERFNVGNSLVGTQERMRCTKCGKRGADLLRVYCRGKPPAP